MKTQFNITTSECDLDRFASREEFLALLDGFDGVELMYCGEDPRNIIRPDNVVGFHMSCPPYWLDFWNGDLKAVEKEFDTLEKAGAYYGGETRQALVEHFRRELARAKEYGAEYVVFHVADSSVAETLSGCYRHTDEEVIDASCDLLNHVFACENDGPVLLLENLWEPGLTFTRPDMTARLLEGIRYKNTGLMLDTGHLLHTNLSLRSQKEGLAYIHSLLDLHGELCRHIRGIHLNQSLTGSFMRRVRKNPPKLLPTWEERMGQVFEYVFQADQHRPFVCPGVREMVERIAPDYLTYEFISNNPAEHRRMLRRQRAALEQ